MRTPPSDRDYDVLGFGEASIDEVWRLPRGFQLGHKAKSEGRLRIGGGQIATALVAASRLGARAGFLGPLGDDAIGAELTEGLRADGVALLAGSTVPGLRTRTALILVEESGERTVLGSDPPQAQPVLQKAALKRTRALHLDGTWPEVSLALAAEARALGVWVSLDLDHASEHGLALIARSDVAVLGRGVASALTGQAALADALAALAVLSSADALLVETRGDEGALALVGGDVVHVRPFTEPILDTTACGDTFRGALLVALLDGFDSRRALRFASAAAALKCRDVGRRGCPSRAEVEALVAAD